MQPIATDLGARIAGLSDVQAVWAVDRVGREIAAARGQAPAVLSRKVRDLPGFDPAGLPAVADGHLAGDEEERTRAGLIARYALTLGVDDPREEVRRAVSSAVAEALEPDVSKSIIAVLLIGGAVLLGLAILGKLEITEEGKIVLRPGLPGIKEAGEAVGALIGKAIGAG